MKKKLLVIGLGVALSMTAVAGNLTLQSVNESNSINVSCNGIPGLPIVPGAPTIVPYSWISALFGSTPTCTFTENGGDEIGTASLQISPNSNHAKITSKPNIINPTEFSASIVNSKDVPVRVGQYVTNMTVTLTKKKLS